MHATFFSGVWPSIVVAIDIIRFWQKKLVDGKFSNFKYAKT